MENIGKLCLTRRAGETLIIKTEPPVTVTFHNIKATQCGVDVTSHGHPVGNTVLSAAKPLQLPGNVKIELLEARSRGQARLCISAERSINIIRGELVKK